MQNTKYVLLQTAEEPYYSVLFRDVIHLIISLRIYHIG